MLTGASSEEERTTVVVSLNIALVLCERGIGQEFEPYVVTALDGAFRAKVRARLHGAWRFDGPAITTIRHALEVHDEQVKIATKAELRSALTEVLRRVNSTRYIRRLHERK